jgi:transposase-like protein
LKTYSLDFKKAAVEKWLNRGSRTIDEISSELGIHSSSLYHWKDRFGKFDNMKNKPSKPNSRSTKEKIKFIVEYNALPIEKRGEYLRQNGLYEEHLKKWENQINEALCSNSHKDSLVKKRDLVASEIKIKKLEKELNRKDRALAEASALLILKKKADLIWGVDEEN